MPQTTDRAVESAAAATIVAADLDSSVLVVGDSFPHGRTVARVARWRQRSLDRASVDGRSPWSADALISGGPVL